MVHVGVRESKLVHLCYIVGLHQLLLWRVVQLRCSLQVSSASARVCDKRVPCFVVCLCQEMCVFFRQDFDLCCLVCVHVTLHSCLNGALFSFSPAPVPISSVPH